MTMKRAFWVLLILFVVDYGALVFWGGPMLDALANGGLIPDLRLTGYSLGDMSALLGGAEPGFVPAYVRIATTLDRAAPVLAGATFIVALWTGGGWWRWLIFVPLIYVASDLIENTLVVSFMTADTLTNEAVTRASMATELKWISVFVTFGLVALRGVMMLVRGRRG